MNDDPLLIGAVGGSGTRIVARLLRAAGVYMGSWLNEAQDSEPIQHFYNAWLRCYLDQGGCLGPGNSSRANEEFRQKLEEHLIGIDDPGAAWGVKVPRSILMLGFWQNAFPRFRFVHVIRNGLDMAYSSDQRQLTMVGDLVLSESERTGNELSQAMAYWCRVNTLAADLGEQFMPGRYFRIRYEDLCDNPDTTARDLAEFVNEATPDKMMDAAIKIVRTPKARWRSKPSAEIDELARIGGSVLERFGYNTGW